MKNTVCKDDDGHRKEDSISLRTHQSNIVLVPGEVELRRQSIELSIS